MIGIGIDTGGTYTDAVVYDLDDKRTICCGKALTTHQNLELGIAAAMDKLNKEALQQAGFLSLSTTLATNACVENIGGRAKLIFINVEVKTVFEMYESYGLPHPDEIYFLDTGIPDWQERFIRDIPSFEGFDSLAVVQIFARQDNARSEKIVQDILNERSALPCICGYDLFQDLNVLRRGASALLNARLIPVIQNFIQAVEQVLQQRGLALPIVIVRSDGSLMSLEFALDHPVETLLCGPAASIIAGTGLTKELNALIVDMGGTTTDIAVVEDGVPVLEKDGISIGDWKTFVKGDFNRFSKRAAALGTAFAALCTNRSAKNLADDIYDMAEKKLYCNLVRILLKHEDSFYIKHENDLVLHKLIEDSYAAAKRDSTGVCCQSFTTKAALIGIGAPTHIFLTRVAKLLHTKAVFPENAHVANALGAVIGNVSASYTVLLKPVYTTAGISEYLVYGMKDVLHFEEYEPAKAAAIEEALKGAGQRAQKQGAADFTLSFSSNLSSSRIYKSDLFLEEEITGRAIGRIS